MNEDSLDRLHVLIADENEQRLDQIATVVSDLGHTVVSRLTEVSQVAAETERERPDVAVVGLGLEHAHALDLISAIVRQSACPVIVDVDGGDPAFVENAARRGIFASFKHDAPDQMRGAIDVALRRYAEFSRAQGALSRRALIEQAKGILMERYGITADEAFARLRHQARNTNHTLNDVAEAVTLTYPLFRQPTPVVEAAAEEP
jgi:response regulator NasT